MRYTFPATQLIPWTGTTVTFDTNDVAPSPVTVLTADTGLSVTTMQVPPENQGATLPSIIGPDDIKTLYIKAGTKGTIIATIQAIDAPAVAVVNQQQGKVATGNVAASGTATLAITWASPFVNAGYTVTYGLESTDTHLRIVSITAIRADGVDILVANDDAAAAHSGTVHAVANA